MRFLALCFLIIMLGGSSAPAKRPVLHPCPVAGSSAIARCGAVPTPEDRRRRSGRTIMLNIIVLPMSGAGAEGTPLFDLGGGPGVAETPNAPFYATELRLHLARRRMVLIDMRGAGGSNPLHCPGIEAAPIGSDVFPPAAVVACRRDLGGRVDVRRYSTVAAAHDLDAVRAALGYDKIDISALSYGTLLAQTYLKLYPTRVRAAALIGTVAWGEPLPLHHSINAERTLRQVFGDCGAERECAQAFPNLPGDWETLRRNLQASPLAAPAAGEGAIRLREGPFMEAVRGMLNTIDGQRHLPLLITRAAHGDFAPFVKAMGAGGADPITEGLYLSVTCPEATRRITERQIIDASAGSTFGRYRVDQQIAACRLWPGGATEPGAAPVGRTPMLFLSGGRDASTPGTWARRVAAGFPNSRVVTIPAMTHLPVGLSNMICLDEVMERFFERGSVDGLDTGCIASMTPPPFVTSP